jgi:integrase
LSTDLILIKHHLKPFFAALLLTDIHREALQRYIDIRLGQTTIRCGERSKKSVSRGTVSNELSLLRRMMRVAAREGFKVIVPSFEKLIVRTARGGRELAQSERKAALAIYSPWMRRLAMFALETCLSEGDLLRLTKSMIDEQNGVIRPAEAAKRQVWNSYRR